MPILHNAKKALRVSQRKAVVNSQVKAQARTTVKLMRKNPTVDNLKKAFSAVDKAVRKNIFHRNKAARVKSQLSKLVA